jgi:hypothetical protein
MDRRFGFIAFLILLYYNRSFRENEGASLKCSQLPNVTMVFLAPTH